MAFESPTPAIQLTGPMFVGLCLNWALFGCLSVQTYYYNTFFPKDHWRLKALVYFLYLWDVAQTIMYTQGFFWALIDNWGTLDAVEAIGTNWFSVPVMSGVASGLVQSFYALRVYRLSGSRVLFVIIILLALMESSAALALGLIMRLNLSGFSQLQVKTAGVDGVWLLGSSVCDVLITMSLLVYLNRARRGSSIKRTETLLTRLIRLSVGVGSITACVAIIDSTLYLVYPHNNYHMTPAAVLGKLYTNSLLVLMNSRRIHARSEAPNSYLWKSSEIMFHHSEQATTTGLPLTVEVNVESQTTQDNVMMVSLSQTRDDDTASKRDSGVKSVESPS